MSLESSSVEKTEPNSSKGFFIHPTAIVEPGAVIEKNVKVWHFCHVRGGSRLSEGVLLSKDVYIDTGVTVGKGSRIQNSVNVYQGVKINDWCFIGPAVIFTNDRFPRVGNRHWKIVETELQTGCAIGAGAIIRCGIKIGAFSMVAAGAVLTKSLEPFTLASGLPAKAIKRVCACGQSQHPLKTPYKRLLRKCCEENLSEPVLRAAERVVRNL